MLSPSAVEDILRVFALTSDFVFFPVEIAGPDLAYELAEELTAKGHPCVTIEPNDDASWAGVVTSLFGVERKENGVVMVIGSRNPPRGVHMGLRLFNQNRGSIAKHLGCALFWCGPESFLELTAESAPDFWSIRAVTRKIETEAPLPLPAPAPAPKQEMRRDIAQEAMAQGDVQSAARLTMRKAEGLFRDGKLEEAEWLLIDTLPTLRAARDQDLRAEMILSLFDIERSRLTYPSRFKSRFLLLRGRELASNGSLRRAEEAYEEALLVAQKVGEPALAIMSAAYLAALRVRIGLMREEALKQLDRSLDESHKIGDNPLRALVMALLASAKANAHDKADAERILREAKALWEQSKGEPSVLLSGELVEAFEEAEEELHPPPGWLKQDELAMVHGAAVSSRLSERREALLSMLDVGFAATLPTRDEPSLQMWSDLKILNRTWALPSGEIPLEGWLVSAKSLSFTRVETNIFVAALTSLRAAKARLAQVDQRTATPAVRPALVVAGPSKDEPALRSASAAYGQLTRDRDENSQFKGFLDHETVLDIYNALITSRVYQRDVRAMFFGKLPPEFVSSLAVHAEPSAQALLDLHRLNRERALKDGTVPFARWLEAAIALAVDPASKAVFESALARVRNYPVDRS